METHSSFLAWIIPWAEEPGGLQSRDCKESDTNEHHHTTTLDFPDDPVAKTPCSQCREPRFDP